MHRIANDNEIMAMAVSGISYRVILGPVLAFGVVLTLVMIILTQSVIPQFYGLMGKTLAGDVTHMIANSVEKGVPFHFGDMQIFAEQVKIDDSTSIESGADERIVLRKMVAAELDKSGKAVTDVTAAVAIIDIYRNDDDVQLKIVMNDAVSWDEASKELRGFPRLEPTRALTIPNPNQGETGSMTFSELLEVRDKPKENYPQLKVIHDRIVNLYGEQLLSRELGRLVEDGQVIEFEQIELDRVYSVKADRVENGVFTANEGSQVVVIQTNKGKPSRRYDAAWAKLVEHPAGVMSQKAGESEAIEDRRFNLELYDLKVESLDSEVSDEFPDRIRTNQRESIVLNTIKVPPGAIPETDHLSALSIDELAAEISSIESKILLTSSSEQLKKLSRESASSYELNGQLALLLRKRVGLDNQVTSRINRRFALSLTTLLLLLLGSILAVLLKRSMPLTVYMWAFLPALLDLVLISSGSSMIRSGTIWMGLLIMWSGNLFLLLLIALAYRRLARH
ncbi:MAG: LptF/LptG family permease, partial [Planctomycetota bacterium]|nr:LptF/LptG family permease [Planctomycetota bacterium]